jgi:predicted dinucleotide-binding enzyme
MNLKIAVLGTGSVGQTLAGRLTVLGHSVKVGTRDVASTMSRTEPDAMGNAPFATWEAAHVEVQLTTFADAVVDVDVIVNALSGSASLPVLQSIGAQRLADKILLDVANPLDSSKGSPPTLFVKDDDSLGEQIQRAFPDLKVVKALNTLTAALMVNPKVLADGDHTVFVSGNDSTAKQAVTTLLESFGHTDVIDLGDISTARGTEMLLPIWLRLMGSLNTVMFNFKVVR